MLVCAPVRSGDGEEGAGRRERDGGSTARDEGVGADQGGGRCGRESASEGAGCSCLRCWKGGRGNEFSPWRGEKARRDAVVRSVGGGEEYGTM